jgi:hypothetical protein
MRKTADCDLKFTFSNEGIEAIATALPSSTDPARSALLPAILRAWAEVDLHEHLSRGGRAATRYPGTRNGTT